MSKKQKLIAVAIVILIVVLLFKNKMIWEHQRATFEGQREHQHDVDVRVIDNAEKSDPAAVYAAEIRLSVNPTPRIKKQILELMKSKSPQVRAGAAFFLANQNDQESINAFKVLLKDSQPIVRENIARGFNYNPTPERVTLIREFMSTGAMTDSERVQAFAALYRSVPTQDEKNTILKNLLEFGTQEKNSNLSQLAILELCNLAPQNEKVTEQLRKSIQKRYKMVATVAVKTLSVKRDSWLNENIDKLSFDSDIEIKRAAVESLHFLCPINRWAILEKGFRDEKNLQLKKDLWLAEAEKMSGEQANEFFERLIKSYKNSPSEELGVVQVSFSKMKKSPFKDPCQATK